MTKNDEAAQFRKLQERLAPLEAKHHRLLRSATILGWRPPRNPAIVELHTQTTPQAEEDETQSARLYEILSPHVEEIVVAGINESRGQKSDVLDAFRRAE